MSTLSPAVIAKTVRELPALPAVVMELIEAMGRDNLSAEQLAIKLSRDQALTAKTLRLANSSFYGVPRKVASISDAISILGMRTVSTVVTAAALAGTFNRKNCASFDFDAFWRHSIGTALCAKALAQHIHLDEDTAFTLGLLHDIGRLALATFFCEQLQRVCHYQREHDCLPQEAELAILGMDHASVGGFITEHWRFSPLLVEAVALHHAPVVSIEPNLIGLVHVADNMAHALGFTQSDDDIVPALDPQVWASMKLSTEQCQQIFGQAQAQFDGVCQALLV